MKAKGNGRVLRNVFITSLRGCPQAENLSTRKCEDPPTWKGLLSKCRGLQVALIGMDLEIAKFKGEGGIEFIEPPAILDDPEFFEEPDGSSSE